MSEYHLPENKPPKKKMKGWVIGLIIGGIAVFLALVIGFFVLVASILAPSSDKSSYYGYSGKEGYVAVLHIEGTITSAAPTTSLLSGSSGYDHDFLMSAVDRLMSDADNSGILLFIDTPGGEVYATDELYLLLEKYKETTGRPIYAYCASMAASGGYYLACSADSILMNRNCMTGSIGVTAGTYVDISGFLEKQGITTTSIYVGKNKNMGSYFEGFTEEQKAIYMSILEESYDQFVQVVADGRGLSTASVKTLADGRIFSPKQALEKNLIDGIMGYEEAKDKMVSDSSLPDGTEFVDIRPTYETSIASLLGFVTSLRKTSELDSYLAALDMPVNGPAYYYEGFGS